MERVRKAINIIGRLLAAVGFLGLFVSGGWQGEFFPGFFIMIGACMGLILLGALMAEATPVRTARKHRRMN